MKTKIRFTHYTKSREFSIQYGEDPSCKFYDLDIDYNALILEMIRLAALPIEFSVVTKEHYSL